MSLFSAPAASPESPQAEREATLFIWGAGGHAKVVLDTARALGHKRICFVDDSSGKTDFQGYPVLRPGKSSAGMNSDACFVIAIGDNRSRAHCFGRALQFGWKPVTLVHPAAAVSPNCQIGRGSVVFPKAVVNAGAVIGDNCIVNSAAVVEHDCRIGNHVHISPAASLGGGVKLLEFAHVGMGSSVLPEVDIGAHSIIGAGAVVLKSVPAGATAVGVPSRLLSKDYREKKMNSGPTLRERILLSVPHMGGEEQRFVDEAFASNWLSTVGPNIAKFEQEFGDRFGTHALAVGSGTSAIHLGLRALGAGPGDRVFCSDFTFVASANPILYVGATPVFIDSDRETWNMDPDLLGRALAEAAARNQLPKAVIVVHLFGQCADMDPILEACRRYGVPVLEDAAEALGANYKGRPAGCLGDIAAFSFNGNKIITTTGGGMLVSRRQDLIQKAQFWATQAREPGVGYQHVELGYNYRLSNVLAGIGRGQLQVLDLRVKQRRAVALRYAEAFAGLPGVTLMPQAAYGVHTNWLSCFLLDEEKFGCSRDQLIEHLDAKNIESRPVWKPMHMQPLYQSAEHWGGAVSEDLFHRGICLPSSSSLSLEQQAYVIKCFREAAVRRSPQSELTLASLRSKTCG